MRPPNLVSLSRTERQKAYQREREKFGFHNFLIFQLMDTKAAASRVDAGIDFNVEHLNGQMEIQSQSFDRPAVDGAKIETVKDMKTEPNVR